MTVPARIKIARAADTSFIGNYGDASQFLSYVAEATPAGDPVRRLFTVLHLFDGEGAHVETRAFAAGAAAAAPTRRRAEEKQQEWLRQLRTLLLRPIEVQPFRTELDGVSFGLFEPEDQPGTLCLEPLGLRFGPPWDGAYERR